MLIDPRLTRQAAAVATILLMGSGCTTAEPASETHGSRGAGGQSDQLLVIEPGRPGEAAATLGPDAAVPESSWNHSDVMFMQMMVPHHAQALEMAELARSRAASEQVQSLARRISGAQGPEIMSMSAWLQTRGIEVPGAGESWQEYDHSEHGHPGMVGMLSDVEMKRLAAARGREFDVLFLRGMIRHHRGAVEMAERAATTGTDLQVQETAADVATGQTAEIARMRDVLEALRPGGGRS